MLGEALTGALHTFHLLREKEAGPVRRTITPLRLRRGPPHGMNLPPVNPEAHANTDYTDYAETE